MKKIYLLFICFLCLKCVGQINYSGTVVDNSGKIISGVVVKLFSLDSSLRLAKFGFTNSVGQFSFNYVQSGRYKIELSALGYKTRTELLQIANVNFFQSFELDSAEITLNEVIIRSVPKIAQNKGDTIIYNINAAKNGTERTLGDVLNKLVGIEVDDNGIVKAQGQKVGKILIDGKEFFGNKHQMATQNIDADMIAGAELYTQFKNEESISGFDNATSSALNIKLKDKYKNKLIGNIEVGGGFENHYNLHMNIFKFAKKSNLAFIKDANNIGKNAITIGDYINMRGGILNFINTADGYVSGSYTLDDSQIPTVFSQESVSLNKKNYFGALNFTSIISPKIKIEGYGLINKRVQAKLSNDQIDFLASNNLIKQELRSEANALLPNFYSKIFFKPSKNLILSLTNVVNPLFDEFKISRAKFSPLKSKGANEKFSMGNTFNLTYAINSQNLIRVNTFFNYDKKNEKLNVNSQHSILNLSYSNNEFLLSQSIHTKKNNFGIIPTFVNKSGWYKFTITLPFTKVTEGYQSVLKNNFNNNTSYKLTTFSPTIDAQMQIGEKMRISSGLTYSKNKYDSSCTSKLKNIFNKRASFLYSFNAINHLTISFSEQNSFPELFQIIENPILVNYQLLQSGKEIGFMNIIKLRNYEIQYTAYDFEKQKSLFLNLGYKRFDNLIGLNSVPVDDGVFNMFRTIDFNDGFYNSLKYDFKLKLFAVKNTFLINYNNSQLFVNNQENPFSKMNIQYAFSATSQFKSKHQASLLGSIKMFNSKQLNLKAKIFNCDFGFNYFWKNDKNISLEFGVKYSYQKTSFSINKVLDVSPTLHFSPIGKKYELSIIGNNILNLTNNKLIYQNFGEGFRQNSVINVMPGYILFQYKRNFKL